MTVLQLPPMKQEVIKMTHVREQTSTVTDAFESGMENLNSSNGNQNPDTDHGSMGSLNYTSSVSQSKPGAENDRKEAQSEVGNICGLAMSQTKVIQVSKTPEGSQAEGCDSREKEKTEGERMDTNDRSRSSHDPYTSSKDRDLDRRDRCGMKKGVGRYTLQCNDTHMLQTLGFKEHFEQRFVNLKLKLEFRSQCTTRHSQSGVK